MKQLDFQEIKKRLTEAQEADQENRSEALDDLEFIHGQQWPDDIKTSREAEQRPCLTINQMPQFVRQVTGDIRRTNPGIDVIPGDADATQEMAEIYDGIIRAIEYRSGASSIYERAAEGAASCGLGHWRILYAEEFGENHIHIEGIPNPFAVHWDPLAKDPTRKDARYCFVVEEMARDDFEGEYPNATPVDADDIHDGNGYNVWATTDTVTVAEYWCRTPEGIYFAKVSGAEMLEEPRLWPGKHIPVIAVVGEEIHIGRRVVRNSVIRHAKDSQRMYNFMRSAQAELIALQPKAPYKITATQIKGYESYWNNVNRANLPYLLYNPDTQAPGSPQREAPPIGSAAISQEIMVAAQEMKATTGIQSAALGEASNEKSGIAIRQRQMESDLSTSIYIDNMSKAIEQCGRILVDLIPKVYDTTRAVQVVGVDGKAQIVELNTPIRTPFGDVYENDPSFGEFVVRIKSGPGYSTQRQEAVEKMLEFVAKVPQAAAIAGDLIARNMDLPGADDLADRMAKLLPPEMRETPEDMTPDKAAQMQQQQQVQQMAQQMEVTKAQAEVRKEVAQASEAASDAEKASLEVQEKQLALAMQSGQMNAAIAQLVQQEVARALQQALLPQRAF